MASPPKMEKFESPEMDAIVSIGTHDGTFHCDDVLACSMLRILPQYQHAEIVRSRVPEVLDKCTVVVDVGGEFDPKTNRFDHHQRTFSDTLHTLKPDKKWTIKLSSAGLVYTHYGHDILAKLLNTKPADVVTDLIFDKVYENFIQEIDAIDNGVDICDGEKRYDIHTNLSSRIAHLNPGWNDKDVDLRAQFDKAMELAGGEFIDCVMSYHKNWLPARDIVVSSVKKRFTVDGSGEIMVLDRYCPWKDHLLTLEEHSSIPGPLIKYVLYEDDKGNWRIQCVPAGRDTFANRRSLPATWCGLRDAELCATTQIGDCIFVHASGFIGGNKTYIGALQMAQEALH